MDFCSVIVYQHILETLGKGNFAQYSIWPSKIKQLNLSSSVNLKAMTSTSSTSSWALLIIVVHQLWPEVFHIKKYTFCFKVLHFISTNSYLSVQQDKEHAAFHFISAPRGSFPKLRGIFIVFVRQRTPGWGELTEAVERGEIKLTQKCFQLGITLLWWEKKQRHVWGLLWDSAYTNAHTFTTVPWG